MSNLNSLPPGFRLEKVKDEFSQLFGTHKTGNASFAESIANNGFDLSRCGSTAKDSGAPSCLFENDPIGVFSNPSNDSSSKALLHPGDGYVFFEVSPEALVLVHDMSGGDAKRAIKAHYGSGTSNFITSCLVSTGAHLVADSFLDTEMIVLRPNIIKIKEAGIFEGQKYEVTDPYDFDSTASY
ncbi:hypothetical protein [Psychromonas sp. SP041]|uniref:hypothetical protein n=1 Tax=Psychromonas sp. SP041 TaxID=1365007 RepID=UPI0010C79034|nr:hypothetical protein [Psychromonas sp. SP041]